MKACTFLLLILAAPLSTLPGQEIDRRTLTGVVRTITVDDLSDTLGLSRNQTRYTVRITLEEPANLVIGFGEPGRDLTEIDKAKLALLQQSMQRGYTVAIRLDSVVKSDITPSHARVVAVSIRP
jgi:hypothetical protein